MPASMPGPLLLTSGTEDHTVPLKVTKEVFSLYSKGPSDTDFHEFEGRGPFTDHRPRLEGRR